RGPVTRKEARIRLASSKGVSVRKYWSGWIWRVSSPWRRTERPRCRSRATMVRTSSRSGTRPMMHASSASRVAARMGKAALLAPAALTVPLRGLPPSTTMAIGHRPRQRRSGGIGCPGGRGSSPTPAGYLEAGQSPVQGRPGPFQIPVADRIRQAAAGPLQGGFRPADVDLLSPLGGVGQDDRPVAGHFEKAARHGHVVHLAVTAIDHVADAQGHHHGGVVGPDADVAPHPRHDEGLYPFLEYDALGRHYFKADGLVCRQVHHLL